VNVKWHPDAANVVLNDLRSSAMDLGIYTPTKDAFERWDRLTGGYEIPLVVKPLWPKSMRAPCAST
jgi:hypothetical protein